MFVGVDGESQDEKECEEATTNEKKGPPRI
jgi:hypothetical protein